VWVAGMIFLTYVSPWEEGKGILSMFGSCLYVVICAGLLVISSLSKGQIKSSRMRALETCFRVFLSIAVAVTLCYRGEIHPWQLSVFLFVALMFGSLQCYLYMKLQLDDDLQYCGRRISFGLCMRKWVKDSLICSENDQNVEENEELGLAIGLGREDCDLQCTGPCVGYGDRMKKCAMDSTSCSYKDQNVEDKDLGVTTGFSRSNHKDT